MFITFEGLDGSGKSTHLKLATAWLADNEVECTVTHEPGGTLIGEKIRRIFLDDVAGPEDPAAPEGPMDGVVELLLVFASRRRHLTEVIEPSLEAGRHVVCDRFTDSSYAYQGAGRGLDLQTIDRIDEVATGRRVPDRTLLFDISAEVACDRGSRRRRKTGREAPDRLDLESLAFFERVRRGFLQRAADAPERFVVISSEGPIDETSVAVRAALSDLVAMREGSS